ncbi:hypothetical protein ACTXT7_006855 [Hymenolepis weldensis]
MTHTHLRPAPRRFDPQKKKGGQKLRSWASSVGHIAPIPLEMDSSLLVTWPQLNHQIPKKIRKETFAISWKGNLRTINQDAKESELNVIDIHLHGLSSK